MRLIDLLSLCLSVLGLYGLVFYLRFLLPRNVVPQLSTALNEVDALLVRAEAHNAIPNAREDYRAWLAMYEGLCNPHWCRTTDRHSLRNQLLRARTESHRSPQFFQQFRLAFCLTYKLYVLRSQIEETRRELEVRTRRSFFFTFPPPKTD